MPLNIWRRLIEMTLPVGTNKTVSPYFLQVLEGREKNSPDFLATYWTAFNTPA
jgi:hypothetical protein